MTISCRKDLPTEFLWPGRKIPEEGLAGAAVGPWRPLLVGEASQHPSWPTGVWSIAGRRLDGRVDRNRRFWGKTEAAHGWPDVAEIGQIG